MSIIFCLLRLGMLAIPKKKKASPYVFNQHVCMNVCIDANVLEKKKKNMSARVHKCIREYPHASSTMCMLARLYVSACMELMFALGCIVLCKRGGCSDDALPLAQCQTR